MPTNSFLDSNVLLYLLEPGTRKSQRSRGLVSAGAFVSVQVLNEYSDVARRKRMLCWDDIVNSLEPIKESCVVLPVNIALHERALSIVRETNLRIFDANIVAAAELAGCDVLYTEDLNNGQRIGRVTIVNPFI